MKSVRGSFNLIFVAVMALFIIGTAVGQVDNMRGFPAGARGKVKGLILSRNGDLINLREDGSNRAVVIALDELTQVQLKKKGSTRSSSAEEGHGCDRALTGPAGRGSRYRE